MNILLDTNVILEYFAVCEKYAIAKQLFEHLRGEGDVLFMSAIRTTSTRRLGITTVCRISVRVSDAAR